MKVGQEYGSNEVNRAMTEDESEMENQVEKEADEKEV